MACRFLTRPDAALPADAAAPAAAGPAAAPSFEMAAPCCRPPFASLAASASGGPARRPAGTPLFSLARAAALVESDLRPVRVKGDGRCMFRALALGMARNQGRFLGPAAEEQEADQLRLAVAEALCRTHKRRSDFGEAVMAVEAGDTLAHYCKHIMSPTFWGGEAELLVLSKMLSVPIYVYLSASEAKRGRAGFSPIQKYGEQYAKPGKDRPRRRPVRLLYSSGNHYDLLVR